MKRMLTPFFVLIAGALSIIHCGGDSESDSNGSKGSGGQAGKGGASGTSNTGGASTGGASTGGASTGGASTGGASTGGASGSGTGGASGTGTGGSGTGGGGSLVDAATNDPDCPTSEPTTGSSCADAGVNRASCRYTNGDICFCGGGAGGMRNWQCVRLDGGGFGGNGFGGAGFGGAGDGGAQCPMNRPNNGSTCFTPGRSCPYGQATCTCQARDGAPGNGWSCQ